MASSVTTRYIGNTFPTAPVPKRFLLWLLYMFYFFSHFGIAAVTFCLLPSKAGAVDLKVRTGLLGYLAPAGITSQG